MVWGLHESSQMLVVLNSATYNTTMVPWKYGITIRAIQTLRKSIEVLKVGESMAMQHEHYDDQTSRPKKRSRLIIDIVPELRRRIKIAAAENDLSIQEYVGRILDQVVPPERSSEQREYGRLDRAAVDKLLRTREAIMRAHPGQVFEDSSELIYQAREERSRELEQR
jgi:hypothetical protein